MRLLFLLGVAACSFEHGIPPVNGGDGSGMHPWDIDGGGTGMPPADAAMVKPPDASIDAPCADDDQDNICNTVDDWPCGAKPTAPANPLVATANSNQTRLTINNTNLDQTQRLAVATANEQISLAFSFSLADTSCQQACVDQVEIGWSPGSRLGCVFDDVVSPQNGESGNVAITIRAPTPPSTTAYQVYDLRVNIGQNYSCTYMGASGWWGGAPAATRTIAKLCVH